MTFDPTKPVQTRDGKKARIICVDKWGKHPIGALVTDERDGKEDFKVFYKTGYYFVSRDSSFDLVNIPELKKPLRERLKYWHSTEVFNMPPGCDGELLIEPMRKAILELRELCGEAVAAMEATDRSMLRLVDRAIDRPITVPPASWVDRLTRLEEAMFTLPYLMDTEPWHKRGSVQARIKEFLFLGGKDNDI